jgi:hypothetical protein
MNVGQDIIVLHGCIAIPRIQRKMDDKRKMDSLILLIKASRIALERSLNVYYLPRSEVETSRPVMVDGNIPIEIVKQITRVIVTSQNAGRDYS